MVWRRVETAYPGQGSQGQRFRSGYSDPLPTLVSEAPREHPEILIDREHMYSIYLWPLCHVWDSISDLEITKNIPNIHSGPPHWSAEPFVEPSSKQPNHSTPVIRINHRHLRWIQLSWLSSLTYKQNSMKNNLKHCDDGPQERIEVLSPALVTTVRQHFAELTAKQVHAEDATSRTQQTF